MSPPIIVALRTDRSVVVVPAGTPGPPGPPGTGSSVAVKNSGTLLASSTTTIDFTGGAASLAGSTVSVPINILTASLNFQLAASPERFALYGRIGVGWPVPYLSPSQNNQFIAFDIFPKGSPGNQATYRGPMWVDLCSTDILADGTNFECLRLTKLANGAAIVGAAKGGTGTVRPLQLQQDKGPLIVGANSTPETLGGVVPTSQITSADGDPVIATEAVFRWSSLATTAGLFALGRSRGSTVLSRGVLQDNDRIGQLAWYGDDGTNFIIGASIRAEVEGTPTTGNMPTRIVFSVRSSTSGITEVARFQSDFTLKLFGPGLTLCEIAAASVPSPAAGTQTLFLDTADHKLKRKDSGGTVTIIG